MTTQQLAILLGGVLPAVLFGVSGVFQKVAMNAGLGIGPFLIGVGLTAAAVGVAFLAVERNPAVNVRGLLATAACGGLWAVAVGCVVAALRRYDVPISQLVPLYNMNTLVAVAIGLALFAEWRTVHAGQLAVAAVLVVLGGVLAARS